MSLRSLVLIISLSTLMTPTVIAQDMNADITNITNIEKKHPL
jgi:hypothetical protein